MLEPFVIKPSDDRVQVWAAGRLPLDRPGWAKRMRDGIRDALARMKRRDGAMFSATLTTADPTEFDVENVLLYNVGAKYFGDLTSSGLTFRRSADRVPPNPEPMEGDAAYFHDYSLVPIAEARPIHTQVASRWSFELPAWPAPQSLRETSQATASESS
jgi:hypothetical protein